MQGLISPCMTNPSGQNKYSILVSYNYAFLLRSKAGRTLRCGLTHGRPGSLGPDLNLPGSELMFKPDDCLRTIATLFNFSAPVNPLDAPRD